MHNNFFANNFFDPKKPRKTWFLGQKSWKMAHMVSTPQRVILHESLIAWNFWNKIRITMLKKIFFKKNFLTPKSSKNVIVRPKNHKNGKVKNFGRNFFLVGIDSECLETYFKRKILKSKIFSHYKIFSWDSVIFCPKWPK